MVVNRDGDGSVISKATNNGVFWANYNIASQLQLHGKQVCLVTRMSASRDLTVFGVPVLPLEGPTDSELANCLRNHGGCDVLIENTKATVFRLPIANRHLVIMHNRHHLWGVETYGRSLYGLVQRVICVSEYSRNENQGWGLPRSITTVIPNGVDTNHFYPREVQRIPKRLIYAGYCSPRKGIHLAIETFQELKRSGHEDAELVVCGKQTAWEIDPVCQRFQRRGWLDGQRQLDWKKIERECPGLIHKGVCTTEELATEFSQSSFLILPSRMDTFGLVAIEAQACGCVPILPAEGPFRENIPVQLHPLLHEELSVRSIVDKIEMAFAGFPDPLLRAEMIETARTRFTWEKAGKRYLDIIDQTSTLSKTKRFKFASAQLAKRLL